MNGKVDGTAFFVEALMESNAAASVLLSKLIPKETPLERPAGPPTVVTISTVAEGQMYAPGHPDIRVLLPHEECHRAWTAYRSGPETWAAYLVEIEPQLTKAAFENLCRVEAPEPKLLLPAAPLLLEHSPRLDPEYEEPAADAPRSAEAAEMLARLEALSKGELENMTIRELMRMMGEELEPDVPPSVRAPTPAPVQYNERPASRLPRQVIPPRPSQRPWYR